MIQSRKQTSNKKCNLKDHMSHKKADNRSMWRDSRGNQWNTNTGQLLFPTLLIPE